MTARLLLLAAALTLAACTATQGLSEIGRGPQLSEIENPTARPDWRPVSMPMPAPQVPERTANSLWRPGARAFFKDQRASNVGDIVTVLVSIQDEAELENRTIRSRDNSEGMGLPRLLGLESSYARLLPAGIDPSQLIQASSTSGVNGTGAPAMRAR